MNSPRIRVRSAGKQFVRQDHTIAKALDDVSFEVQEGEFLVLLGPSGCGKSTLLRSIAGLENLDSGSVELNGVTVFDKTAAIDTPTEQRRISMMFQSYALWPHMTVARNVAYPLRARGARSKDVNQRVADVLKSVHVGELTSQYPGQLSGGQAQRVALARALVSRDKIILFDEPLSNVDAKVREHLRLEIARIHRESGFTAVYVTHDQEEALTLATRICVMKDGQIRQSGTPREIYDRPNSRYVAQFLGSGNEIPARWDGEIENGKALVETSLGRMRIEYPNASPGSLTVFSRPESWRISTDVGPIRTELFALEGLVSTISFLGSYSDIRVKVEGVEITVRTMDRELREGQVIRIWIESCNLFGHSDQESLDVPGPGSTDPDFGDRSEVI